MADAPVCATRGPPMSGAAMLDVVIADDYDDIRFLVRRWSVGHHFRVVGEAADGLAAIEAAATYHPDVLVLNVFMPTMDGLTAIAGIRRASPHTRIVMFSAYAAKRNEALRLGAHEWVSKSGDWQELFDAIHP